jgi:hypothetical protein
MGCHMQHLGDPNIQLLYSGSKVKLIITENQVTFERRRMQYKLAVQYDESPVTLQRDSGRAL